MRRASAPQATIEPGPLSVKLSVELSDGSLVSHVSVPLDAPKAEKDEAVQRWLKIMMFGLSMHGSEVNISASLPTGEKP